jgi:hypothetical protein
MSKFVWFRPTDAPDSTLDVGVDVLKHIDTTEDPHLRVHLREQASIESMAFITSNDLQTFNRDRWSEVCGAKATEEYLSQISSTDFQSSVAKIANHFLAAPPDLRIIHLEDFVEDLAGQTVGDKHVYTYLQLCILSNDM